MKKYWYIVVLSVSLFLAGYVLASVEPEYPSTKIFQQTYGGSYSDSAASVQQVDNSGYTFTTDRRPGVSTPYSPGGRWIGHCWGYMPFWWRGF